MKRLYEVVNFDTREVFRVFASNERSAKKLCRCTDDDCQVEEMLGYDREASYPIYMLKDIPAGSYFRYVNCNSHKVGNRTYIKDKDSYNTSTKKYCCTYFYDICDSREFKPTQWVVIDFTF
jgi:hypothetical protein